MGIRQFFKDLRTVRELRASKGCDWMLGGSNTAAGVKVTEDSVLGLTPFSSALTILSGSVSQLPLKVYQKTPSGKLEQPDHPVNRLLQIKPNREMTAVMFRDSRQQWVNAHGNGYAEIERDNAGRPISMWPLESTSVEPTRNSRGELVYEVKDGDGYNAEKKIVPAANMLHIPGFGFDGITGRSIIAYARESLGEAQATQAAGASFWRNGARPTGVLEFPNMLGEEQYERLRKSWADKYSGAGNSGKPMLLEGGAKWSPTSIPPEDAQYLQTRNFQVADIARMFNMPPHMLGDLSNAHFTNIEHQNRFFLQMTLMPWLIRWEQECWAKLFSEAEQDAGFYVEHSVSAFLRGDTLSRYNAYKIGRDGGWLSVNDIRTLENQNPVDGGDEYLVPLNMTTAAGDAIRAHQQHIQDALGRVVTKEVLGMRSYLNKDGFAANVEKFYAKHADHIVDVLTPAMSALGETLGKDCTSYLRAFAQRHSDESLREMRQLGAHGAENELRVWEQCTAEREAELIIKELTDGN